MSRVSSLRGAAERVFTLSRLAKPECPASRRQLRRRNGTVVHYLGPYSPSVSVSTLRPDSHVDDCRAARGCARAGNNEGIPALSRHPPVCSQAGRGNVTSYPGCRRGHSKGGGEYTKGVHHTWQRRAQSRASRGGEEQAMTVATEYAAAI